MNQRARDERIRVFVSSPADVEHERAAVKDIVERLGGEYLPYFQLQAVLWEEEALTADRTFQAGLTQPEDCDIVLVILWTRLGSPLPEEPYHGMTGTEWEFVNAVEASARSGTPEVLVYKKTAPKLVDITDGATAREAVEDRRRLDEFFRSHFFNEDNTFRRAFRIFDSDATFRELVETQLRKLLNRRISAERRAATGSGQWQGSPFRAARPFDIGDERVFTGREQEVRTLLQRLEQRPADSRGLLLLSGPSGSGKTSLLRAGLVSRLTRPFLFEHIATVRSALVNPAQDAATPLAALASRLCGDDVLGAPLAEFGLAADGLERLLAQDPALAGQQLASALGQLAKGNDSDTQARLAIVVDPLDSVLADGGEGAEPLLKALQGLARHPAIWVVVSLRSDALRQLAPLRELLLDPNHPAAEQWLELAPPALARIRQVIEIPARVAGIEFDDRTGGEGRGMVERIETEAAHLQAWAPALQALLQNAYEQAQTAASAGQELRLTADQIQAAGGLAGTILARADALWAELDAAAQAALPRVCRALIAVEGAAGDHPEARHGDLEVLRADPDCRRLVEALIDARLVIAEGVRAPELLTRCDQPDLRLIALLQGVWRQGRNEWRLRWLRLRRRRGAAADLGTPPAAVESAQQPDIQLAAAATDAASTAAEVLPDWRSMRAVASFAHPALITHWSPVQQWLGKHRNRDMLWLRSQLSRQSRLWKRTDCNREYLYREVSFAAAQELSAAYADELEPIEQEFLDASVANLNFLRRRNRMVRIVGLVLVALLLGAMLAAGLAWQASRNARVNLNKSLLKEAELHIARGNTPQAIINAIDASADLPEQSVRKLSLAFNGNRLLAMAPSAGPDPDSPRIPAFSASGDLLATISPGQGAMQWRLDNGRFVADRDLEGEGLGVHSLVFGDEDQILGIGTEGVWRLPAAGDAKPAYPCGTQPGSYFTTSPNRELLAIALTEPDGRQGLCVLDLTLPGKVVLRRLLREGEIRGLSFSPDGTRLVTAATGGRSHVFDLSSGRMLLSLPADGPLGRPFNSAVFDATGERIAIAAVDERVRLYQADGTPISEFSSSRIGDTEIKVHRSAVRDVVFAPRGDFLVAVDDEGQVVRWALDGSGQAVVLGSHNLSVADVDIAPHAMPHLGGQHLVLTASLDETARLWSLETGKPIAVLGHDAAVSSAHFNADGERLSSFSSRDGTVRLWSVAAVTRLGFQLDHPDHVWDLDMAPAPQPLAPNGETLLLATAGFDGGVRVWRYERTRERPTPEPLHELAQHSASVRQVRFAPGGRLLASAGNDGTALVQNLVTRTACPAQAADADDGEVYNALFGPNADWLLTTSNDPAQPVRLFSSDCAQLAAMPVLAHGDVPVPAAALTTVGERTLVATGDDAGVVRVFVRGAAGDWQAGCSLQAQVGAVGAIALSADGRLAAVAGADARATMLDLAPDTGDCSLRDHLVGHAGRVYSAAFSPDGKYILTASLDKTARVWARDGTPLAILMGHQDRIYRAEFSPDGRWMLTASRDGSIRLWRTPEGPAPDPTQPVILEEFLPLQASLGGVAAASFSPDGHYIAGAYWENAAMLWRIWRDGDDVPAALRRRWGEDRARLALIREAYRFRADNAIVDAAAQRRASDAP